VGTTRSQAGSAEAFRKVDYTYTMSCAKLMKTGGIKHFHLMTSMGANANSWFLYPQTKGQVEEECKQIGFDKLSIYRPGLLFTPREQTRTFESIFQAITPSKKI
jgi:oxidoreductase